MDPIIKASSAPFASAMRKVRRHFRFWRFFSRLEPVNPIEVTFSCTDEVEFPVEVGDEVVLTIASYRLPLRVARVSAQPGYKAIVWLERV